MAEVRAANVGRPHFRFNGLIPVAGLVLLIFMVPFGGLAAVITTVPAVLLLIALYLPVVAAFSRAENDVKVARAMWIGFGAKLFGFVTRFVVITSVYDGADFKAYHLAASTLAPLYRSGNFFVPVPGVARGQGTLALSVITGLIYTMTGSSLIVGALVFSLLSFTGLVLCIKAFRLAVPDADHPRYARLVLYVPSLFFWPSSIGKDAWMIFGLGVLAYGASRVYVRCGGGLVLIFLGIAVSGVVRPHIALVAFGAAALGLVFRRVRNGERKKMNMVGKVVLLVPLVFSGLFLLTKAQTFLKIDDLSVESVQAAGAQAGARTNQGGSSFTPIPVRNPAQLPLALVTVLFRPFPFEVRTVLSFGISLEASFLFLFTLIAWRRILAGLRAVPRSPFLALCGVYTLAFVAAFSNIANFGILARERVQVYPFFFAFLAAVPTLAARKAASRGERVTANPARAEQPV